MFAWFALPVGKAVWLGFGAFCSDHGLDPKAMACANVPDVADLIAKCGPGWNAAVPIQRLVGGWRVQFQTLWDEWMTMA